MTPAVTNRSSWIVVLTWALAFVAVLAELASPRFLYPGIDAAWQAVSGEALDSSAFSVRDIVSTFGPFSPIYTGYFVRSFYPIEFALSCAVAAPFAWASVRIFCAPSGSPRTPGDVRALFATIILVLVFVLAFTWRDMLLHVVGLYVGFAYAIATQGRWRDAAFAACGAVALAILCLAKLSTVASAGVALVFIDLWRVTIERRLPVAVPAFLVAATGFLVAAGFHLTDLPRWLSLVGDVISGYSGALALAGPASELAAFLVLAVILTVSLFRPGTWTVLDGFPLRQRALVAFLYAGFLFAIFKAGFVRADLHSLVSWGCLAAMLPVLGGLRLTPQMAGGTGRTVTLGFTTALLAVMFGLAAYKMRSPVYALPYTILERVVSKTTSLVSFVTGPRAWLDATELARRASFRDTASEVPLPEIKGSVDSIPTIQSALIAHRLDYRPRPSFPQLNTYGARLVAANKAHYRSSARPDYVLFFPEVMDNWYPNLAEGALWEELLRYYEPSSRFGQLLVLKQRANELGPILTPAGSRSGKLGEPLDLTGSLAPVFAKIRIKETLFGAIKRSLFRASEMFMRVRYTNRPERVFKLVPSIAAEGFLLSPTIDSGADFAALALGAGDRLGYATSIVLEAPGLLAPSYATDFSIELFAVNTRGLKPNGDNEALAGHGSGLSRLVAASERPLGDPSFRMLPEGLFAHAPTRLAVPVTEAARDVTVSFGIVDGTWRESDVEPGVCFKVSHERPQAAPAVLINTCLRPKTNAADVGQHTESAQAELAPGDTVVLETVCMTTCSYGWSYWSAFSLR